MNSKKYGKLLAYVGFVVSIVVIALNALGIIGAEIMLFVLGIFGFSGIAGLRAWIDSNGLKTYVFAACGIIIVLLQLILKFDFITLGILMGVTASICGITITQGVTKANG